MQEQVLEFIRANQDQPFFMYYASPIPHLPLQAPQKWVDHYVQKFGEEDPYNGQKGYFPTRYPRATYAAMISYLDQQVGEIVQTLKDLDLYENTLIIFTSDNGPSYTGGVDAEFFNSAGPFSNAYGRTKGYTYEGGIRVPMIASWPGAIAPNSVTDHISAFWDVFPTLVDLLEGEVPSGLDGMSFLPTLLGKTQQPADHLYWEFSGYQGQQAVRKGNWKAIRKDIAKGNLTVELYNLEEDPGETMDLAADFPDIVSDMENIMQKEHEPSDIERFQLKALGD
jgi:arylsulfatase